MGNATTSRSAQQAARTARRTARPGRSSNAQSTTPPAAVHPADHPPFDIHVFEQKTLARACQVSTALISRMLSHGRGGQRKDPKLSTLLKLQAGLEKLTGERLTLEHIGVIILS